MKLSTLVVPCLCALIVACAPSVTTEKMDPSAEATLVSPAQGQVPFALRTTDLYIAPAGASSSASAAGTAGNVKLTDACTPATKSTGSVDHSEQPPIADWRQCLDRIQLIAVPVRGDIYLATAKANTTISIASLDADPLLLKSVTISQTHTLSDTVTAMGADVAAGVAAGGPVGIGIGSLAALYVLSDATGFGPTVPLSYSWKEPNAKGKQKKPDNQMWNTPGARLRAQQDVLLCKGSTAGYVLFPYTYDEHPVAELILPVTATISIDKTNETGGKPCWKPLPGRVRADRSPLIPLWFYRVVTTDPDPSDASNSSMEFPPVITRSNQSDHGGTILDVSRFQVAKTSPNQFATSACRMVEVDVVWWQELDKEKGEGDPQYAKYTITVADPSHAQVVNVPDQKSVVINFNPICGAYASNTAAPAAVMDGLSALIQADQTIKKAEPSASKSSK